MAETQRCGTRGMRKGVVGGWMGGHFEKLVRWVCRGAGGGGGEAGGCWRWWVGID